jgi:flagellar hook-length control protein FliK
MAQLDGSVRWLIRNNEKSAEIQLYPEHLGKVTVRLRIEGNEVHARVWASEASTLPMLKEHKAFLETSLKEQGLNLSSFDLQHGSAGQQARGEGQNKPQGQNYHFAAPMMESWNGNEFRQELPTQLTAQPADDGSIELYA